VALRPFSGACVGGGEWLVQWLAYYSGPKQYIAKKGLSLLR